MRPVALLLALCLACSAPDEPAETPPPSILLVTLDTVRADRIGAYGYEAAGTPTLDRLAAEGVLFESAVSTTPMTHPSHASILTGVDPPAHGVRDNGIFVLAPEALLISEVLQRHGWRTGAFVGSYILDARFGLDQGFEVYSGPELLPAGVNFVFERGADAVIDDAVKWLQGIDPAQRFFAWIHFYDPHADYTPPEPWAQRFEDPYDGEIAFCDGQIARLLSQIEHLGLGENLLVVVTADHGESFGEHGEATHGSLLYQATLHVPLILAGGAVAASGGTRVAHRVSNSALPATLLTLAGLSSQEMPGLALGSLLEKDGSPASGSPDTPIYLETELPYHSYRWRALRGLLQGDLKLIEGHESELYDIAADPFEHTDLAARRPEELAAMRTALRDLLEAHPASGTAKRRSLGPGEREMLAALGYASGGAGDDPYDPALPDPRDRVGDLALYDEASVLFAEAHRLRNQPANSAWQAQQNQAEAQSKLRSARELMRRVVRDSPDAMAPANLLGMVETLLGNYETAAQVLEKMIRLYPFDAVGRHNLALAYFGAGRSEEGVRALQEAIELEPDQPAYPVRLAIYYLDAGDAERAAHWLAATRRVTREESSLWVELDGLEARVEALRSQSAPTG